MKEYKIVCDRETTYRNGESETEKGAAPINETGRFDHAVFDTTETTEYWLTYAKENYPERTNWVLGKIHQYNFRIQSREVTDWRDEK